MGLKVLSVQSNKKYPYVEAIYSLLANNIACILMVFQEYPRGWNEGESVLDDAKSTADVPKDGNMESREGQRTRKYQQLARFPGKVAIYFRKRSNLQG